MSKRYKFRLIGPTSGIVWLDAETFLDAAMEAAEYFQARHLLQNNFTIRGRDYVESEEQDFKVAVTMEPHIQIVA